MAEGNKENKFEIEGKVYAFGEQKDFPSGYYKRDLLVEITKTYNEKTFTDIVKIVCDKERVDSLNVLSVGDMVNAGFSLSGRMWKPEDGEERNFTDLKAIWIQKIGGAPQTDPAKSSAAEVNDIASSIEDEDMDPLPF
jgi:hypothetical protein